MNDLFLVPQILSQFCFKTSQYGRCASKEFWTFLQKHYIVIFITVSSYQHNPVWVIKAFAEMFHLASIPYTTFQFRFYYVEVIFCSFSNQNSIKLSPWAVSLCNKLKNILLCRWLNYAFPVTDITHARIILY